MSSRVIFQGKRVSTRTQFLGVSSASYRRRNHVSCSDTTAIPSTKAVEAPYDAVIIGGGHNGLVAAAYLSKAGKRVAVFESRHVLGGAAVTEEIVPGFKFSRASYLLSLLRPTVFKDLELKKHGLKFYVRDPNSFTPIIDSNQSLLLGRDHEENRKEIAKFSVKDAEVYAKYEAWLERISNSLDPLMDEVPFNLSYINSSSWRERLKTIKPLVGFGKMLSSLKTDLPSFYDLVMSPASKWFESDVLKASLATDAVIGTVLSPHSVGSGYILLHHIMGEIDGMRNAWCYVAGGMGSVSGAIARSALSSGAHLFTEKPVKQILVSDGKACGVLLEDGTEVESKLVLSNATPRITFETLLPQGTLSDSFQKILSSYDYSSAVTKINVALKGLPQFSASPAGYDSSPSSSSPGPHHRTTIHLNTESMEQIHRSSLDYLQGKWSQKPLVEMCLPSVLDPTLAPRGCHVASLFTQYTPYSPAGYTSGSGWSHEGREKYTQLVFDTIEGYAPGFKDLIIDWEMLTPPDLERIFGLTGGNIFHGSLLLSQLYVNRPTHLNPDYTCPDVEGLILCGSGAHPGGGVVGSAGRLAAQTAIKVMR